MIRSHSFGSRLFDVICAVVLFTLTLLCLVPIWYCLMISLSEKAAVQAGKVFLWPVGFNLFSYQSILSDAMFFNSILVSVLRVILAVVITMSVLVLAAYPLSRTKAQFPARDRIMWLFVFCMLFNGGLIPWYITIKSYGLMDNIFGLALCGGVPIFNLILIINFIRNLPAELEEAAEVDGAGPWTILFQIMVPLLKPVLATVLLFTMVGHWNDFFQGMILSTKQTSYPLQTYIQQMVVSTNLQTMANMSVEQLNRLSKLNNDSLNAAKIFIAMIPILLVYPFLQRYFVKGITLGSVKG